jgi:phage shock protein A
MATLLEKVSTLITANLHALVDQALKTNSMAVIDQYIRQVEDSLEDLEDAAATVGGEVKTLRRKLESHEEKSAKLDEAVDAFLVEGKEEEAAAGQSRLNSTARLVETYTEQITRLEDEYQKLLDAKVKLETRLATMKVQRTELQSLLELAKSKEIVVETMKGLDDLMGAGDSDISGLAGSIYKRLDKATAATEIQAADFDEQMDELLDRTAIDNQLADRKKKLKLEA